MVKKSVFHSLKNFNQEYAIIRLSFQIDHYGECIEQEFCQSQAKQLIGYNSSKNHEGLGYAERYLGGKINKGHREVSEGVRGSDMMQELYGMTGWQ